MSWHWYWGNISNQSTLQWISKLTEIHAILLEFKSSNYRSKNGWYKYWGPFFKRQLYCRILKSYKFHTSQNELILITLITLSSVSFVHVLLVILYTHHCLCLPGWKVPCHIFTFFSTAYSWGHLCFQGLISEPMSFHTFVSQKSQYQDGFRDPTHYHKIMGNGTQS